MAWKYLQTHLEGFSAVSAALLLRHSALHIRARRFSQSVRPFDFVVSSYFMWPSIQERHAVVTSTIRLSGGSMGVAIGVIAPPP